ncbi:MAG: hypothetical protein LAT54_05015, partial [Cryomorphaceae bacterium]|nr:hypothetical protein [Cryomorphaceae bacterium]
MSKDTLSEEDITDLALWCEEKPLFATAQMLLLHALKSNEDHHFQARQKKAALVCPDRKALFNYLNPIDVLEPSKPSLDFTPPKKLDTYEDKKPEAGLENKGEKQAEAAGKKANTSVTSKEEAIIKTTQNRETKTTEETPQKPLAQKVVVKEDSPNTKTSKAITKQETESKAVSPVDAKSENTKDTKPLTSKPVSEKTKSDSSNNWQARIAALKAKSEAIIAKTKDVAKDEDITAPQQHTDKSISNESGKTIEEKTEEQPIEAAESNDDASALNDEHNKSPIQEEHIEETADGYDGMEAFEVAPAKVEKQTPLKEEPTSADNATPSKKATALSFNDWLQKLNKNSEPIDYPKKVSSDQQEEKSEKWQRVDA